MGGSSSENGLTTPQKENNLGGSSSSLDTNLGGSSLDGISITKQLRKLMDVMNYEFMSIAEIMEACQFKNKERFRENYITPALNEGLIERKYPDQPKHPYQRYRLTEKAMHLKYSQTSEEQ